MQRVLCGLCHRAPADGSVRFTYDHGVSQCTTQKIRKSMEARFISTVVDLMEQYFTRREKIKSSPAELSPFRSKYSETNEIERGTHRE
jgi:hypothetical protein